MSIYISAQGKVDALFASPLTAQMPNDCWNFEVQQRFTVRCRDEALLACAEGKTPAEDDPVWSCLATVLRDEYRKCDRALAKGGAAPRTCVLQSSPQAAELLFAAARAGRVQVAGSGPGKGSGELAAHWGTW